MSNIRESSQTDGVCSCFFHKENTSNKFIQGTLGTVAVSATPVALGIIAILGIVAASLAYCSYLSPTIGYSLLASAMVVGLAGIGISLISAIASKKFRFKSLTKLDRKINVCRTFSEIKEIIDQAQLEVSCSGTRYLTIEKTGKTTVDHVARRVEKKIATHLICTTPITPKMRSGYLDPDFTGKTFIYKDAEEEKVGEQLFIKIWQLFDDADAIINKRNVCTQIRYYAPRWIQEPICYNNIRQRYIGNVNTMSSTIGKSCDRKDYCQMPPHWGFVR